MKPVLQAVLHRPDIWSGDSLAQPEDGIASGFPELDAALPGGGWPRGGFSELILERQGIGELRLVLPALAGLSRENREVIFVSPPHIPYAPALVQHGIALSRFLWIRVYDPKDKLWAAEQALRSGSCGAVLCWLPTLTERIARRLQSAAEAGKTWGVQFTAADRAADACPAPLRMRLSSADRKLQVRVIKRRGGGWVAPISLNVASNVDHVVDLSTFS
ncbi:MAG: translesion DNA synthesis-associated protein ImuA [Burkholderiales bacterium]|nr:translesion DNA synthesis-associated protein ImuA [Burkholderiales bacterium]